MTRALALSCVVAACGGAPSGSPAQIIDLSAGTAAFRTDFDAHRGEARFVALLSPT